MIFREEEESYTEGHREDTENHRGSNTEGPREFTEDHRENYLEGHREDTEDHRVYKRKKTKN